MEQWTIEAAAAAAILSTSDLTIDERAALGDVRYYVHPHVAEVEADEAALVSYLEDIYSDRGKLPLDIPSPKSPAFQRLRSKADVREATRQAAIDMAVQMESVNANPGILFGFLLKLAGSRTAHGLVKADMEEDQRFFMDVASSGVWTIESVRDILPPPATKYAKFAIAPRPRGPGAAGVRDTQAGTDSAANYFLRSLGVVVPRQRNTKRDVAQAARRSGYEERDIRRALDQVTADTSVEEVIDRSFPDISEAERRRVSGPEERPLITVKADDPFLTTYYTRRPRFALTVDDSVTVSVEGSVITVTLPDGHDQVDYRYDSP